MNTQTSTSRSLPIPQPPAELLRQPSPIVSVYIVTPGAIPNAQQELALRWRGIRHDLAEAGAPQAALAAVGEALEGAHMAGDALVVIAGPNGPLYTAHLPDLPGGDLALVGPLPHLTPLLAATQRLLPHIVMVTDRLGAEIVVVKPDALDLHAAVVGESEFITKAAPGGWSQRRYQQRAENTWQANAGEVADRLTRLVDAHAPRVVVMCGDVRAVQFLRDQVPPRVAALLREVEGEYGDVNPALRLASRIVAEMTEAETSEIIEAYQREHAQGDLATAGPDDTLHALNRGQVRTLLIDPSRLVDRLAWFGPEPNHVAASAKALRTAGVADPRRARLDDIAIRAALGTGASVRVSPPGATALPPSGIAALLRYR